MANVKLVLNPINVTGDVILIVQEVQNLGATVYQVTFPPPHTQRNHTIAGLAPVMHRFFFWESPAGSGTLQTLLGSADIDAGISTDAILEVLELTVDGGEADDPVGGSSTYVNSKLIGVKPATPGVDPTGPVYQVFQRGVGPKLTSEFTDNPVAGGFTLTGGDAFSSGDVWIVNIYRKLTSTTGQVLTSFFNDILRETADFSIDDSFYNRKIVLAGGGAVRKVTVPSLSGIPARRYFIFDTNEGSYNYAALEFTDGVLYQGRKAHSIFWLPPGVEICFAIEDVGGIKQGTVIYHTGADRRRGALVFDEIADRPGYVLSDGTQYTKAAMPGLYDFVAGLAPGVAVSMATWDADVTLAGKTGKFNRARWAIDLAAETFRVPDRRNLTAKALPLGLANDGNRTANVAGGFQLDQLLAHRHLASRQRTKRGTGGDPNEAMMADGGTGFGGSFDFNSGGVEGASGDNIVRNFGQMPMITL